jgi:hypothetical protein
MGEQIFTMKCGVVGWPSIVSNDLVQSVEEKNCERWCFIISELSCESPQISCSVLCEIVTVRLRISQLLHNRDSENAHGRTQNADNGFGSDLFRTILQRW